MEKKIKSALISVFYKDGLEPLARQLVAQNVTIYSTGGTQKFLEDLGIPCVSVESVTGYPSILGGRVKTLHPSVFGGILGRRYEEQDLIEMAQYKIPDRYYFLKINLPKPYYQYRHLRQYKTSPSLIKESWIEYVL